MISLPPSLGFQVRSAMPHFSVGSLTKLSSSCLHSDVFINEAISLSLRQHFKHAES